MFKEINRNSEYLNNLQFTTNICTFYTLTNLYDRISIRGFLDKYKKI